MNKYYITTDQTSDFPEILSESEFSIIPMTYSIDGKLYDGEETPFLPSAEFYRLMADGKTSSTSMVSVERSEAFFEEQLKKGFDILHISFSSALSGCFNSYKQAAENLKSKYPERKLYVVDSLAASAGEGLLVNYALKKRSEGAGIKQNFEYISDLRHHIGHSFTVNDMFHLYRGGRVSKGAAVVGKAIKIKPVLMVNENGELIPYQNVIGRKIAIKALAEKMEAKGINYKNDIVIIAHGDCIDDANILKGIVEEKAAGQRIIITEIGAVIGSHCGKGVLALFYLADNKFVK